MLSLLLSLALPCLTVARPAAAVPRQPVQDAAVEAEVDALAAGFLARPGGVGLSIGVGRRGKLLLAKGYGLADAELEVPAKADTLFRIASVTKQFTAAAVMKLVERGQLSLEDTLAQLVPELPTPGHTVTLRHLLAHTSGLPSYTDIEEWAPKIPLELTDAEMVELVAAHPFDFEPGADWHYNNSGYYLLGMILARADGTTYGEHLRKALFEPLHLERTRYDSHHDLIPNRAQGYALEGDQLVNDLHLGMSQPGGAGGLLSTGGELVRWSMALTGGQVVSPESFTLMSTSTILPGGRDVHYGFGLELGDFEGRPLVKHEGAIFGFNSALLWLPDEDFHVAVLSNGEALPSDDLAEAIAYAVLDIQRAAAKDEPTGVEQRARLAGTYRLEGTPMEARVFAEGDRLLCQATGQEAFGLKWQGGEEFRADFDDSVRVVFDADAQGFTLYQGGGIVHAERLP